MWSLTLSTNSLFSYEVENPPLLSESYEQEKLDIFVEDQLTSIEKLSKKIEAEPDEKIKLDLLNTRGLAYFFIGEFDSAIEDFSYVLSNIDCYCNAKSLSGALWGRLLSYALTNRLEEVSEDARKIESLIISSKCCEEKKAAKISLQKEPPSRHCAIFAYPNEIVTKKECHERVRTLQCKAVNIAELIPSVIVREIVKSIIADLADDRHHCCQNGNHWTECLGPIANLWQTLEDIHDQLTGFYLKGINIKRILLD